MNELTAALKEELNVDTAFTPVSYTHLDVYKRQAVQRHV